MALLLKENPGLIDGSNVMEEIEVPEIDATLLLSLLEESHCEEYYNEEQLSSLMESLEAEIRVSRIANRDSCSAGDMESNDGLDCFEWTEMELVPSSPSDDMNWYVEDHVEEMEGMVEFGNNDFPQNYYEIPSEQYVYSSLWQETYDAAIYN